MRFSGWTMIRWALLFVAVGPFCSGSARGADFTWRTESEDGAYRVELLDAAGEVRIASPDEGLWSIAFGWEGKEPADWRHIPATERETLKDGSVVLHGSLPAGGGKLILRDIYTEKDGLLRCVRRFEYEGDETLSNLTLSVRFRYRANRPTLFLPGICYSGNPSGERNTPGKVPTYHAQPGEFALFEDHRYPIPFACFEDAEAKNGAAIYTLPSPVVRGDVPDQWWSMGVRTLDETTHEFDLYSGFVGFNRLASVVKGVQAGPMDYPPTTMRMIPGTVIEKTFWLDLWPIDGKGTAFQKPVRRGIELFAPFGGDGLPTEDEILTSKFAFARSRWIEGDGYAGFNMYPEFVEPRIVFGWCGQADSCGYSFLRLAERLSALSGVSVDEIYAMAQRSLDHLTTSPVDENGFSVEYRPQAGAWVSENRDPVSMGQGMYNFAKAIEAGRSIDAVDTAKWERFLKAAALSAADRIFAETWRPRSTAEGFFIAPLILASRLFEDDRAASERLKAAAVKGAEHYAERHLTMDEPYWGGTLDASCEDKEGAWGAFQGFLTLYEVTGEPRYLTWAKHAGEVCLSYLVVWDIPLPPGRLSDHNFKSRGWTVVSPQNQHLDVYGVLFAPEVKKLGELTGIDAYSRAADVMFRSCGQLLDPFGSQGEQIQQTNFAQHGDMTDVLKLRGGYSESWTVFWITAHFLNAAARFSEMND